MKILCETQVVNRLTQGNSRSAQRVAKATLAIGYHCSAKDANGQSSKELEIIHFTPQNKAGRRYKVKNNIEKMFTKFLQDGKATISFKQPAENLMIKCDPIQLKGFLQALKLGLEGKESLNLRLNIAAAAAIPQKSQPVHKMTVLTRSDYPTKGFPKTLKSLVVSTIGMCKLSFEICSLRNLTSLNLSYNKITKVPVELGRLSLIELNLNTNELGESNNWLWLQGKNLRNSLRDLDLSSNGLLYFPQPLIKLKQLVALKLNNNSLRSIPFGVRRLRNLRYVHFASNQLTSLPAAFNDARLEILDVWDNNFQPQAEDQLPNSSTLRATVNHPVPLWLQAARVVTAAKLPYSSATLPWLLVDILSESPKCACGRICYAGAVWQRAAMATFDNVKELIFSRDRLIYADIVLCGPSCVGLKQLLA